MSTVITAGNATNGLSLSADNTGSFEFKTGAGAGTTAMTIDASGNVSGVIKSGTAVPSTSGTSFTFTGIPSTAKRINIMFSNVSLSGTNDLLVQIGDSGGIEDTGYVSGSGSAVNSTAGFVIRMANAGRNAYGTMVICNITGNNWVSMHSINAGTTADFAGGGGKTLSDTLTQVRITRTGSDTFDTGTINILYE
jgi:hypothetical protein